MQLSPRLSFRQYVLKHNLAIQISFQAHTPTVGVSPFDMDPKVKTRVLMISDTHGMDLRDCLPPQRADVAIHSGDLTDGSKLEEFQTAIDLLRATNAPLKLAIAGNHDFTMDFPVFEEKVNEVTPALDPDLVIREYGSPYTPALGQWGFQYRAEQGHEFSIKPGVDIVVTHGPPKGIMDTTRGQGRAGCSDLFTAIARARPRIHCFGHIHQGWGARLVRWKDDTGETPNHFPAIDNDKSFLIERFASLKPSQLETREDAQQRDERLERYKRDKCCTASFCEDDVHPLEYGRETLFINAAIPGCNDTSLQRPWLVDIELPRA